MEFEFLNRVSFFLQSISLTIWIGGSLVLMLVVAPAAFKTFSSQEDAGDFVGYILERFDYVVIISIIFFLIGILIHVINVATNPMKKPLYQLHLIIYCIMIILVVIGKLIIRPMINRTRKKISMFSPSDLDNPFRKRFVFLHRLNYVIFLVNIVFGILLLFLNQF